MYTLDLHRQKQTTLHITRTKTATVTVPTRCGVPSQPASLLKPKMEWILITLCSDIYWCSDCTETSSDVVFW